MEVNRYLRNRTTFRGSPDDQYILALTLSVHTYKDFVVLELSYK